MRQQTEKMTFSCKDDSHKALHMYWSGAKGRRTHCAGHIPFCGGFSILLFQDGSLIKIYPHRGFNNSKTAFLIYSFIFPQTLNLRRILFDLLGFTVAKLKSVSMFTF